MRVTKYNILIRTENGMKTTEHGLYLGTAKDFRGVVVQVGPKVEHIKVGQTVRYHEHAGTEIDHDGEPHLILGVRPESGEVIAVE